MKNHIEAVHEGKKPFVCDREGCDKAFSARGSLTSHINLVHEGKRPFPCDICGVGFTTKLYLARHIALEKCVVLKQAQHDPDDPMQTPNEGTLALRDLKDNPMGALRDPKDNPMGDPKIPDPRGPLLPLPYYPPSGL